MPPYRHGSSRYREVRHDEKPPFVLSATAPWWCSGALLRSPVTQCANLRDAMSGMTVETRSSSPSVVSHPQETRRPWAMRLQPPATRSGWVVPSGGAARDREARG